MTTALATRTQVDKRSVSLVPTTDPAAPLTVQQVLLHVSLIQQIMRAAMKEGEHYGRIPGCGDKPTLLKPGAEKLCLTFRLAPTYDVDARQLERGHREYRVTATLMGAALSRYFWPVRSGHTARGEFLRNRFGVTDASPLKSRDLRNAIEHFDEKLDIYLAKGIVGVIIPNYIGPSLESDGVPGHLFRAYYVDTGKFEVLGQRFPIPPLAKEIERIDGLLQHPERNGGRLPHP